MWFGLHLNYTPHLVLLLMFAPSCQGPFFLWTFKFSCLVLVKDSAFSCKTGAVYASGNHLSHRASANPLWCSCSRCSVSAGPKHSSLRRKQGGNPILRENVQWRGSWPQEFVEHPWANSDTFLISPIQKRSKKPKPMTFFKIYELHPHKPSYRQELQ